MGGAAAVGPDDDAAARDRDLGGLEEAVVDVDVDSGELGDGRRRDLLLAAATAAGWLLGGGAGDDAGRRVRAGAWVPGSAAGRAAAIPAPESAGRVASPANSSACAGLKNRGMGPPSMHSGVDVAG